MNKDQRKRLKAIDDEIADLATQLEEIMEEENDKFENMPEGLQASEKGEALEQSAEYLQDAISAIDDAMENIRSAIQ